MFLCQKVNLPDFSRSAYNNLVENKVIKNKVINNSALRTSGCVSYEQMCDKIS